ncbi:hypothetical protein LINPERPRIM_LOCUS23995 [Linum perenne]
MAGMLGSGGRVVLGRVGWGRFGIELGIGGNVGRVGLGRAVGIGGNVGRVGFGRDGRLVGIGGNVGRVGLGRDGMVELGIGGRVGSWSRCRAPRPTLRVENVNAMKRAHSSDPLKEVMVGWIVEVGTCVI